MTRIDTTNGSRRAAIGRGVILAVTAACFVLAMTGCKSPPSDGVLPGGEPVVIELGVSESTVIVGGRTSVEVSLDAPAPAGGQVVELSYSNPAVLVDPPATLLIGAKKTTGKTPSITTKQGTGNQIETCWISGTTGSGGSKDVKLTVEPKTRK